MINLPAICDNCEAFFPSGIVGGGDSTVTIYGSKSGPCPNCGSMGSIPDGTYRLTENIIEILSAPERTINELRKLSKLLSKAKQEKITTEELKEEIKNNTPELTPLLDWIVPKTRKEKFKYGSNIILILLTAALPLFISAMTNGNAVDEITPDVIINHNYEINQIENNTHINNGPVIVEKIGRNEPCPCGSGIKYKKCHG